MFSFRPNAVVEPLNRVITAIASLSRSINALAESQQAMARVQGQAVRQQQITNLLVHSQIEANDPSKSQKLRREAEHRMEIFNKRAPDDVP